MSVSSMKKETIVFDAVGTLIRPVESISLVYQRAGQMFGCKLDRSLIKTRFAECRQNIFSNSSDCRSDGELERNRWRRLVGLVFDEPKYIEDIFQWLWNFYAKPRNWQLFNDTESALELAKRRFENVAIASNFDERLIPIYREHLRSCFIHDHLFYSAELGFCKPDLRFFQAVANKLNLPANRLIMVGDDPTKDVEAASLAGWQGFLVDRSKESLNDLLQRIV